MITKETPIKKILEIGSECTRCGHCCKYSSGIAIEKDLPKIAAFLGKDIETFKKEYMDTIEQFNTKLMRPKLKKYPYGECIFLKGKDCSIHEVKPFQCRTGNLWSKSTELRVWFALNYQVNPDDPESVRQWASYLKLGGANIPGGELTALVSDNELLQSILSGVKENGNEN